MTKEPLSEEVVSDFKSLTRQMIHLIREAIDAATCMLLWVNHSREQFVLAGSSTTKVNTLFQDRLSFKEHFLNPYRDLKSTLLFQVDRDISPLDLEHYFNSVPIEYCAVLPIVSQGETIALMVCDFEEKPSEDQLKRTEKHLKTYSRVLNNYMHLTELQKDEESWNEHDDELDILVNEADELKAAFSCTSMIAKASVAETVLFVGQHNGNWYVLNQINRNPESHSILGTSIAEDSFAMDSLQNGDEHYIVQHDHRPKLLNLREDLANKSCLAIPLTIRGRRQGLFMVLDSNPYLINDIKRHKIRDLVRILALRLQLSISDPYKTFLTNSHNVLQDQWMERLSLTIPTSPEHSSWLIMSSLKNISHFKVNRSSAIITKLRSELINVLMPEQANLQGLTTEHADFVYETIIWNSDHESITQWQAGLNKKLEGVFKKFYPEGTEKPLLISEFNQLDSNEDWLFQKRKLL